MFMGFLLVCAVAGAFALAVAIYLWTRPSTALVVTVADGANITLGSDACNRNVIFELAPTGTMGTIIMPSCPNGSTMTAQVSKNSGASAQQINFYEIGGINPVTFVKDGTNVNMSIASSTFVIFNEIGDNWGGNN